MKYILFFILLTSNLFSNEQDKYENINRNAQDKYDNIDKLFISENGQEYKRITYSKDKKKKAKDFTLKLTINKYRVDKKTNYLTVITDMDTLEKTNANYFIKDHMMMIKLDSNTPKALYFKFLYDKPERIAFRFNVISEFEYKYILPFEGILYGLSYGIIFSAFIYYMGIFFSTRRLSFLFYSIMQFFVLLSLIGFVYASFRPYTNDIEKPIIDIFETVSFIFTFLFTKQILDTKRQMPFINHILSLFVLLNIVDILGTLIFEYSILYVDSFFFINFLFPAIAGVIAVYKGNKYAIFYTLGWSIIFCSVYAYEQDIIPLSGIYTIHIAAPMESLIFSFALAYMLKDLLKKQNEQEKLLIHQSKLASMGEMINNIAHQWRQPLSHLSFINMDIQVAYDDDDFNRKYLFNKLNESSDQIDFMSETIDNFRDFYKPTKQKELFYVSSEIKNAIDIIQPSLDFLNIKVDLEICEDKKIEAYPNEYSQVILNLLTNAKDVLVSRSTKEPKIDVKLLVLNNKSVLIITDNAGGIKDEIIDKIFDPYFTTKDKSSGIGLYMSKIIIETHFKGQISLENRLKGACFIVEV